MAELQPELVLLDVQLPDIDGFHVAAQLRRLPDPPAVLLQKRPAPAGRFFVLG